MHQINLGLLIVCQNFTTIKKQEASALLNLFSEENRLPFMARVTELFIIIACIETKKTSIDQDFPKGALRERKIE